MLLTKIFCEIDDFCKQYEKYVKKVRLMNNIKSIGGRPRNMDLSEILTICVYFHYSGYHTFKQYYKKNVCKEMQNDFRNLVSYSRITELIQEAAEPLLLFAASRNSKNMKGVAFIDSTKLAVCHNLRIYSHKVFKGIAQRGKCSTGWFYGFKLHLVINHLGEILSFWITPGNIDDRNKSTISRLTKKLWGWLFGDRGYLSQSLFEKLFTRGIKLVTKLKKNMKNKLISIHEKLFLKKRNIIESTNNILKNTFKIEHSRHRSIKGFFANVFAAIAAYSFHQNKPAIGKEILAKLPAFI